MEHFGEGNDTSATLTVVVKMWGNGDTHALKMRDMPTGTDVVVLRN